MTGLLLWHEAVGDDAAMDVATKMEEAQGDGGAGSVMRPERRKSQTRRRSSLSRLQFNLEK